MLFVLPAAILKNETTLVLRTHTEARAINDPVPSTPGPLSIVTFERLFGRGAMPDAGPTSACVKYSSGQHLATRGQVPDRVLVVTKGIAMMEASEGFEGEFVGRVLIPSEMVGLVEMFARRPLGYDVIASTPCEAISITRESFIRHLAEEPETRVRTIQLLADLVRDADRLLKGI